MVDVKGDNFRWAFEYNETEVFAISEGLGGGVDGQVRSDRCGQWMMVADDGHVVAWRCRRVQRVFAHTYERNGQEDIDGY